LDGKTEGEIQFYVDLGGGGRIRKKTYLRQIGYEPNEYGCGVGLNGGFL
jgi:hypothetical protein